MANALIIVDVQRDFIDGALPVPDAEAIIDPICELEGAYDYVIASQDFHPESHCSFKTWPRHCVMGTAGVELDPRIRDLEPVLVKKGERIDKEAYSAFEGTIWSRGPDIGKKLADWLVIHDVKRVDICGLALDYCVRATALSAAYAGFETSVLLDLTRPVAWPSAAQAISILAEMKIGLVTTGGPVVN